MEIHTPTEWDHVLGAIKAEKGVVLLLGATDTGKSTLAKFLITRLCERGIRTALVDADIGQSFLGPPTTIGLSVFDSPPDWEAPFPADIFFVGSTSPEGYFSIHLRGVKRMVDKALGYGADVVLVDTTGFVLGESGKELKRRKIDLLLPRFILALQRSQEIEQILALYEENPYYRICRLPVSEHTSPRSREERRVYRARKFQGYLRDAGVKELMIGRISLEGIVVDSNGFSIPLGWALGIKDLLVGLKDGDDNTLALGVIKGFLEEDRRLRIYTPLSGLERVKVLHLSSIKLNPSCEDERF